MPAENTDKKGLLEQMRHAYRLVVMNDETFEEVGSYKLSLLNVYILLSTIAVIVAMIVVSIIIFTPVKRYIPGYGDLNEHKELMRINEEMEIMRKEAEIHKTYAESVRKMLVNDVETIPEEVNEEYVIPDSLLNVQRIAEDEELRKEVEMNDIDDEKALLSKAANVSLKEVPLEQLFFIPPLKGQISAEYMLSKKHYGVDVLAPKNTPIKAIMDGYVITSDWTVETGNTIAIQHSNNIISFYKHNSALLKPIGSYVKAGEAVAIIGNTGTLSNGPHLHFELWHKGKTVNPADYINFE